MEPAPSVYGSRATRVLTLDEATKALLLERSKTNLISWMQPHLELIVFTAEQINRNGPSWSPHYFALGGRQFTISTNRLCEGDYTEVCCRGEFTISPVSGFVPMAHFCLNRLKKAINDGTNC